MRAIGVLTVCVLGCSGCFVPPRVELELDGVSQSLPEAAGAAARDTAARQRAAADLSCEAVRVDRVAGREDDLGDAVYSAAGCDRNIVYLATACWAHSSRRVLRFVPLSGTPDAARTAAEPCEGWIVDMMVERLALNQQGARDLDCPRETVIPTLVSPGGRSASIPVAEGCGRRATYLPGSMGGLKLASIVDIR